MGKAYYGVVETMEDPILERSRMEIAVERLKTAPENFAIGRDDYGWWYSTNVASGQNMLRCVGFTTFVEAMMHYIETH